MASLRGRVTKRLLDLGLAGIGLLVASPIMAMAAIGIRVTMGTPVIFRQVRPGQAGRLFTLYKFRTMTDERDGSGRLLPPMQRVTRLGRLLRATSIDELPQLWNVIRGEMSIVGPRPLLVEYLERYTVEEARRHEVKPGITGWAQVNGRNATTWEERLRNDIWYVDNQTLLLDLRIIMMTIVQVVQRTGVNQSDQFTMVPFREPGEALSRRGEECRQ